MNDFDVIPSCNYLNTIIKKWAVFACSPILTMADAHHKAANKQTLMYDEV